MYKQALKYINIYTYIKYIYADIFLKNLASRTHSNFHTNVRNLNCFWVCDGVRGGNTQLLLVCVCVCVCVSTPAHTLAALGVRVKLPLVIKLRGQHTYTDKCSLFLATKNLDFFIIIFHTFHLSASQNCM